MYSCCDGFAETSLCLLALSAHECVEERQNSWEAGGQPVGVFRRDVAASVGFRVSQVNGVGTCPLWGQGVWRTL